jgi:protein TonB
MKYFILLSLIFIYDCSSAQSSDNTFHAPLVEKEKTYQVVEQMPEFPGGEDAMRKFIGANVQYPDSARMHDVQGRVVVGFVVNEDGSLSDVIIKKGVSWDIDREAIRVVKLLPKFKPGMQQGKLVKVQFVLPIAFKLAPNDPTPAKKQ